MSFDIVDKFENCISELFNSPYGIAVIHHSCYRTLS